MSRKTGLLTTGLHALTQEKVQKGSQVQTQRHQREQRDKQSFTDAEKRGVRKSECSLGGWEEKAWPWVRKSVAMGNEEKHGYGLEKEVGHGLGREVWSWVRKRSMVMGHRKHGWLWDLVAELDPFGWTGENKAEGKVSCREAVNGVAKVSKRTPLEFWTLFMVGVCW